MNKNSLEEENQRLKQEIENLKSKVKQEIEHNRRNDEMLFQQSKMASMGEMIGNIAHQWRQPLMELSSIFMLIQSRIEYEGKISNTELLKQIGKSEEITSYMSQTIEDFRNFFAKEKKREEYRLSKQISLSVSMVNNSLKQNNIKLEILLHKNPKHYGYKNEYAQVLINILNNARDALLLKNIENPKIILTVDKVDNFSILTVEDNAGGITIKPIEKVFEPFFTLDKKDGTGIGLFMSKLIVENNMNGKLFVENGKNGAKFIIKIPLY